MRLLGRRERRASAGLTSRLVRVALATSSGLGVLALVAFSPPLRIRAVVWTGFLRPAEGRSLALESACLGRPLLLVSEHALRSHLDLESTQLDLHVRRHLPGTLEVQLVPRRAAARLANGRVVDHEGRVLGPEHHHPALPVLTGFAFDSSTTRLAFPGRTLVRRFDALLRSPRLFPSEVRRQGDTLEWILASSGTRCLLDVHFIEEEIEKLRIFEQSLGDEKLPPWIDLRFRDQVVVRNTEHAGGPTR